MEAERFRTHFLQKLAPLALAPLFGGLFALSPLANGWTAQTWYVVIGVAGALALAYAAIVWAKSSVLLDERGLTVSGSGGLQTWPYRKLMKVKQIGKYRVRMCWDVDLPDQHMHVSVDVWDSDGFVDALLDWYAEATGEEMAFPEAA